MQLHNCVVVLECTLSKVFIIIIVIVQTLPDEVLCRVSRCLWPHKGRQFTKQWRWWRPSTFTGYPPPYFSLIRIWSLVNPAAFAESSGNLNARSIIVSIFDHTSIETNDKLCWSLGHIWVFQEELLACQGFLRWWTDNSRPSPPKPDRLPGFLDDGICSLSWMIRWIFQCADLYWDLEVRVLLQSARLQWIIRATNWLGLCDQHIDLCLAQ